MAFGNAALGFLQGLAGTYANNVQRAREYARDLDRVDYQNELEVQKKIFLDKIKKKQATEEIRQALNAIGLGSVTATAPATGSVTAPATATNSATAPTPTLGSVLGSATNSESDMSTIIPSPETQEGAKRILEYPENSSFPLQLGAAFGDDPERAQKALELLAEKSDRLGTYFSLLFAAHGLPYPPAPGSPKAQEMSAKKERQAIREKFANQQRQYASLAEITGDPKYLEMALKMDIEKLADEALMRQNELDSMPLKQKELEASAKWKNAAANVAELTAGNRVDLSAEQLRRLQEFNEFNEMNYPNVIERNRLQIQEMQRRLNEPPPNSGRMSITQMINMVNEYFGGDERLIQKILGAKTPWEGEQILKDAFTNKGAGKGHKKPSLAFVKFMENQENRKKQYENLLGD